MALCFSDGVHWLLRKRTLVEVDQDLEKSPYRQNDLLLLREPDFSQQELAQFLKMPPRQETLRISQDNLILTGHIWTYYSGIFWPIW